MTVEPLRPDRDARHSSWVPGAPARAPELTSTHVENQWCVLCGRPIRSGQKITHVHGSTVHLRCRSTPL